MPKAKPDLHFALDLLPEKAIEFLQLKKSVLDKLDKAGMRESALAKAASIANLTSLEMTKDIYQSLIEAQKEGKAFGQWQKELMQLLHKKGWIAGYDKEQGYLIADPKTGEYFGTPRRLKLIYRTNMQAAYSAQKYQQLRDNVDNRPYWQYSAINDSRTRPAHSAMHGLIYRYDDPFWHTFYPPNGFNCRCTVRALDERDLKREGRELSESHTHLMENYPRAKDRFGKQEATTAFKLPDGQIVMTDKGFDYNAGRISYRPNLDLYPEPLAHQFAKREMSRGEFVYGYKQIGQAVEKVRQTFQLEAGKKLSGDEMLAVRNQLTRNFKFAAGRLSEQTQALMGSEVATVWLSDDTLIKQFNSREGQDFGLEDYANLPDIIYEPDKVLFGKKEDHIEFYKLVNGKRYLIVIKNLKKELFLQSFRIQNEKEWNKVFN